MAMNWMLSFLLLAGLAPQKVVDGRNRVEVRNQIQDIYLYDAPGSGDTCRNVLFLPGDGGWRGFAIVIAQTMASWGYKVYGWDTKRYLEGFTGTTPLTEYQVMTDFHHVGEWIQQTCPQPVTLVGWSEGAGLCLLAAASRENKAMFNGLIVLGLSDENALAWRWTDIIGNLLNRNSEPSFRSTPYMPQVSPLPLWILQSSGDQYVPVEESNRLFAAAKEPKRYVLIQASNHRFDGNHDELFRVVRLALEAIRKK
jgi:alpha-beta hydrolase superfamily lysophospholipase